VATVTAGAVLADDYLDHDIPEVGEDGRHELVAAVQAERASFPDIAPALGPILAEGDLSRASSTPTNWWSRSTSSALDGLSGSACQSGRGAFVVG
jgi:hypothetical protein